MATACIRSPSTHPSRTAGRSPVRRIAPILAAAALLAATQAAAGDAGAGRTLAEQWCTGCHLIGPADRGSDTAPPFTAIAADPEKDPEHLRTWLATPHTEMPAMPLSRRDIDDLVAYITGLAP